MRTATITVTGRVQGVGFRYALQEAALARGVNGWVRNLRDGRVEAFLAGESEAVDGVIAWAHQGPPAARVEQVDVADGGDRPVDGFEIRSTA